MSIRHHQGLVGDREKLLYQVLLGHTFYSSCFWATFRLWDFGEKVVSGELGSWGVSSFIFCPLLSRVYALLSSPQTSLPPSQSISQTFSLEEGTLCGPGRQ